ncbi:prepilin peptidase [Vibrio europaeus]|uniref:Prepilin peptidase n=1 Tax=Vibrio europaeus TaxID=300876 RepID=A0A178JF96_9VIBR|nr:prepilin peptidase [Vibrio europaeus]MDC5707534.1 prepilin peptidase [Vibrio europaeus]MDC5709780.1 prepilin peptidase [Vibrio europaeus]MDC5716743.1 prepilin peptidase [Vibrio europaeus]MDC5722636.1 prepilin peptidase [Vibrio europaeus]MDC5727063.1 prepilin peptidase [Vibrio europaeus]
MSVITIGWLFLLTTLSILVAISDLISRKIGNGLCVSIALNAVAVALIFSGSVSVIVPVTIFLLGICLSQLGWLGGGDSKLLAAYAIAIDPQNIPLTLFMTTIVGGLVSVIYLVINRFNHKTTEGVPYGVAIAIGGLLGVLASI